jgi:aminoglycoside/choline kinase family phosphotransferase
MAAPTIAPMIPPDAAPDFLSRSGWAGAAILPLAGDASFRRYFRVIDGDRVAVLMDAPPPHEDPRPFLAIAAHLETIGLAPPRILATDLERGLVLLEDFGDARMRETVDADPAAEMPIYERAVDLLLDLHGHAAAPGLRQYDRAEYQREVGLFTEWYAPALGLTPDGDGYRAAWDAVLDGMGEAAAVTTLRDYHAENIMLPADGRLGLLDFQDALAGHPAYDLVSLLQDARRDVSPEIEAAMLTRYRTKRLLDDAAYAVLGAQRNAKILGIFVRLWQRDGKPGYRRFQPRVWRYLERDLAHPALEPVASWFAAHVPAAARGLAWGDAVA